MIAACISVVVLAIWIYLALARGGFWLGRENDAAMHEALARRRREGAASIAWPRVVVIIPARNEAELVGITVGSLFAQRYEGDLSVIVVDDHSDDGTADVALRAAATADASDRLSIVSAPTLPKDWTGKLWAVSQGVARCNDLAEPPEWMLFTDADIRYAPDAVSALVSSAVEDRLVLSSLMVKLRCESFAERTLIPAFVFFFQMLYPFAWVNQPNRRTAAAAGGCVLLRRSELQAAGGIAAIRGSLIDDCALARLMKPRGPIRLALGEHVQSLRPYVQFEEIRRMVVRSAYAQLQFSPWRLTLVVLAMLMVFVAPVVLTLWADGWVRLIAFATWITMAALFIPMAKRHRVPLWSCIALPAIASVYLAFTIESAYQHLRGRGGLWKGRVNGPAAESSS
jgi:hopene-associated glycosyltransferase HpnB